MNPGGIPTWKGRGCSSSRLRVLIKDFGLTYCALFKPLYSAVKVSFRVAREEILKSYVFSIRFTFFKFKMISFRGQKGWATPKLVSFWGLIQNSPRASPPVSYGSPPRI